MASSDKNFLPKGGDLIGGSTADSHHNPSKQTTPMQTYAQVIKNNQQRECFELQRKTVQEIGELTEGARLFIHVRNKNSIVVDGTHFIENNVNFKELGVLLRDQYKEALGLRTRTASKGTQYFEINFRTAEAREETLKKDFMYKEKKVTVSRTFPKDATIIRVSVSELPFEDEAIVKRNMEEIFQQYGEILEMGLLHTVSGHFFTGRGFVTLNQVPGKPYKDLQPSIASWDDNDNLTLTYTYMKPSCSRCHVTDRVFGNCPVMFKQVKPCYICNKLDHLQASCPEAWWNIKKTAKKVAKLNKDHVSPSQHIKKSVQEVKETAPSTVSSLPEVNQQVNAIPEVIAPTVSTLEEEVPTTETAVEVIQDNVVDITAPVDDNNATELQQDSGESDDEIGSDEEDDDIDMEEAAKEATMSNIPLTDFLIKKRKALMKAKLMKNKTLKLMKGEKEGRKSRSGAIARGKQSATESLKL